jgi:hypothetical protein
MNMPRTTEAFDRMIDERIAERERNHKGTFCPYNVNKFCQETTCSGCQVYLDSLEKASREPVQLFPEKYDEPAEIPEELNDELILSEHMKLGRAKNLMEQWVNSRRIRIGLVGIYDLVAYVYELGRREGEGRI